MDCGYIYFSSDGGHNEFYCNSRVYSYRGHKIRRTHVPGTNGKGIYQIDGPTKRIVAQFKVKMHQEFAKQINELLVEDDECLEDFN